MRMLALVLFGLLGPAAAGPVGAPTPAPASPSTSTIERVERGNLVVEGVPAIPSEVTARLEQYLEARSATFLDWTQDDGALIATRFGETVQVHLVERPLGARRQLTFFKEPVTNARWSPDPRRRGFLYTRDRGGDEFFQVYWFDLATGTHRLLTDGKSRNTGVLWSNRGGRFAFSSTRRDGVNNDIWLGSLDGNEPVLLAELRGAWQALDWSPDDATLLVQEFVSVAESRLWQIEVATGARTQLLPAERPIAYGGAAFAKDGKSLFFVSDDGSEFQTLRRLDRATGTVTELTGVIPWDVDSFALSDDGHWLAWTNNEDGIERVHLFDLRKNKELAGPKLPAGVLSTLRFSRDSQQLGFSLATGASPSDLWVWSLKDRKLARWTRSEVGGLDTARFVAPRLVRFPTFDTVGGEPRTVPAFVYAPEGAATKRPVVVQIHGGPEGQSRPTFSAFTQFLVNELGYAVVLPNVRGSTGYGKRYVALDNAMKREDSVKDIGALLDWIATQPDLDASRVVVYGGSYGGYMVLASMVHYADRLMGGIDVVGISNFATFLNNTQSYRRDLRRVEYGDERDPAMQAHFEKISPANHAAKMTKPLFVIQGLNDPRVPYTESEQMVAKIRAAGGRVWYLAAKDEGHGFRKKPNVDFQNQAIVMFLKELAR